MHKIIYESDTTKVFSVGDLVGKDVCVTFFTYASKEETLKQVDGFAEAALAKNGIPAVHFINLQNHWWHIPDLKDCIEAASNALSKSKRRVGYGSSMGGYAALRFSEQLRLDEALVFVPQYSVDRSLVPFEKRWEKQSNILKFSGEPYSISKETICHVVLGNEDADQHHVDLIKAHNPTANLTIHKVEDGGHLILKSYQEIGVLSSIIKELPKINIAAIKSHPAYVDRD